MEKYRSEYLYEYAKENIPDDAVYPVFVLSYNRPEAPILKHLLEEREFPIILCIRREQEELYKEWKDKCPFLLLDNVKDVSQTRKAIVDVATQYYDDIFMFDDKIDELEYLIPSPTRNGVLSMRSSRLKNSYKPRWIDVLKMWMCILKMQASPKVFMSCPAYRPDSWPMKNCNADLRYNSGDVGRCMHLNLKLMRENDINFLPLELAGVEDRSLQIVGMTKGLYSLVVTDLLYGCCGADTLKGGCQDTSDLALQERWNKYLETSKKYFGEDHPGIHWNKKTRRGITSIKLNWKYWRTLITEEEYK